MCVFFFVVCPVAARVQLGVASACTSFSQRVTSSIATFADSISLPSLWLSRWAGGWLFHAMHFALLPSEWQTDSGVMLGATTCLLTCLGSTDSAHRGLLARGGTGVAFVEAVGEDAVFSVSRLVCTHFQHTFGAAPAAVAFGIAIAPSMPYV